MEIRRVLLSDSPLNEIESLTEDSFFASAGFLNLWKVRGGKPVYWTARVDNVLVATLPGVEFGAGVLRRFHSTPNGCYGRVCFGGASDQRIRDSIAERILSAIGRAGYIKTFVNDFYGCFEGSVDFEAQLRRVRLVDITDPNWEPPSKQIRKDIRAAEKSGLNLLPFDADKHWVGFHRLVKLSEERLGGSPKYSPEFFQALADLSVNDDRVRWVWCEHDGEPVASSIFLVEGEHLLSWQVYYDRLHSRFQATKLIRFQIARQMAGRGVKYLNFGVSHEGALSTEEFKARWGGDEFAYTAYEKKSFLGRLL